MPLACSRIARLAGLVLAALATAAQPSGANEVFPSRPIKIVVPVAAGGAPDVVARIVADKLGPKLGQPVIVEDRPGAGERLGAEFVARAEPDGYTLLAALPASLVISPLLFSRLAYDPGHAVGELLDRSLVALRIGDHAHDLRQHRILADLGGTHLERA
jgi:tripartite-type tricarboxylate transporter receptor subunit TctC